MKKLALGDLATCKKHMNAVVSITKLLGGIAQVDAMDGFLRQMVTVFGGRQIERIEEGSPRTADNEDNCSG